MQNWLRGTHKKAACSDLSLSLSFSFFSNANEEDEEIFYSSTYSHSATVLWVFFFRDSLRANLICGENRSWKSMNSAADAQCISEEEAARVENAF